MCVRVLATLRVSVGNQLIGEIHARVYIGEHPLKPLCEHPRTLQEKGPVRFYAQDQPIPLLQIQPVPYLRRQNDPPPVSELEGMTLLSERSSVGHLENIPHSKPVPTVYNCGVTVGWRVR